MFNFEHLLLGFNFDCFTSKSIHTCSHHVNTLSYQVEMWISVIKMWVLCETIIAFIIVGDDAKMFTSEIHDPCARITGV